MSADQLRSDTRVDGHTVSLQDRILAKRFSITALAEGKIDVHRDGYRSQAESEKAKMVRRRDRSVGQEGADGSSVCAVMSARSCEVVGQSLCPPATATATAPLDGDTIFPTCTTTAVSFGDTCQEHSATRAAQATTTTNATPPPICPVVSPSEAEEGHESGKACRGTVCGVSGTENIAMDDAAPEDRGAYSQLKRERDPSR